MTNKEIAFKFRLLASLMELHEENAFKIRSYNNAYLNIRKLPRELTELNESEISALPGVGKAITAKITELIETGSLKNIEKLLEITPEGVASKGVPKEQGATAGFLFFQTADGFNFKSIDALIAQEPKATYSYTEVSETNTEKNNDFNILSYSTERNQNLLEKLRLGAYASFRVGFNPLDCSFTLPQKGLFTQKDYLGKTKNLGQEPKLPKISNDSNQTLGDIPSRIISQVIDIGTMEKEVSTLPNADPFQYQSQAVMRYNLLFTQTVKMTVPLNTNLRAGDIIECQFPRITRSEVAEYDDDQSGLYMIKELCHHFDDENSLTSMKLVRDTYGKYGTNNK